MGMGKDKVWDWGLGRGREGRGCFLFIMAEEEEEAEVQGLRTWAQGGGGACMLGMGMARWLLPWRAMGMGTMRRTTMTRRMRAGRKGMRGAVVLGMGGFGGG